MISFYFCAFVTFISSLLLFCKGNALLSFVSLITSIATFILIGMYHKEAKIAKKNKSSTSEACFHTQLDCEECMSQSHCKKQHENCF